MEPAEKVVPRQQSRMVRSRPEPGTAHVGLGSRMKLKSHWWWDLTARDFAGLDMAKIVAVLPVAAVEQRGPHLPVRVDAAIHAGILARDVAMVGVSIPALGLPQEP